MKYSIALFEVGLDAVVEKWVEAVFWRIFVLVLFVESFEFRAVLLCHTECGQRLREDIGYHVIRVELVRGLGRGLGLAVLGSHSQIIEVGMCTYYLSQPNCVVIFLTIVKSIVKTFYVNFPRARPRPEARRSTTNAPTQ